MKTIIAGCRDITDYSMLLRALRACGFAPDISEVVYGGASGVDYLGHQWALSHDRLLMPFPADWTRFGKSAGPRRNRQMADYADALIAIWDGKSRGTKNMIEEATKRGLKVFVWHASNQVDSA